MKSGSNLHGWRITGYDTPRSASEFSEHPLMDQGAQGHCLNRFMKLEKLG